MEDGQEAERIRPLVFGEPGFAIEWLPFDESACVWFNAEDADPDPGSQSGSRGDQ